ncbi:type 1 glutamine amidotransferase [Rhizobium leguminosarum]|uniref:type 1 glutamine amidotransferase n=1 Tax=Rhizobium leguminosarum TaxID=384 RepID=UPI00143F637F|nr:type 1 glutamine amidotransferase [Rhizobium leguminosarum]NKL21200.1 type 1 glutamine amidotransferase [Rhizobium leguminosarum bv. viciae]NKL56904.1 type 1 glutamine amidotransferase [Rhizobium leguminosarum bv. viciae]
MKRALILQHVERDTPGRFLDFFAEDGIRPEFVRLWAGEEIPNLSSHDLMFALGGPQDVWQETDFPWLKMEKQAIREWVSDRAKPFFGVCLGHQLLSDALGGEVGLVERGEHGVMDVELHTGIGNPILEGLGSSQKVIQWHMAEVTRVPEAAEVLASSALTAVQIMAVGTHAVSTQFHCECSPQSLSTWTATPGYVTIFEKHRGVGSYRHFLEQAYPLMGDMNAMAKRLYANMALINGLRK